MSDVVGLGNRKDESMGKRPTKKAEIRITMAPASTKKKQKQSAVKRKLRKTSGDARRKRAQTDSESDDGAVVTPYKWKTTNTPKDKPTRGGLKTIGTRVSAIMNNSDSANATDSEEDEEDSVKVVGQVN